MLEQAMILCGGSGTRLGALTKNTPKPLLPVGNAPFLDVLLHELGRHGIKDVVLLAAFEAEQIVRYAQDHSIAKKFGMTLRVSVEPERAGTGGALFHARQFARREFLLFNGDSWLDFNLLSLSSPMNDDTDVVMAIRRVDDATRYGVVEMSGHLIQRFLERPEHPGPGLVNAGVYRVSDSIFDTLQSKCSFERDTLPALARRGRVIGLGRTGYFIDIGIPDTYAAAQIDVPAQQQRKAVFLDRDGVLNRDLGYVGSIDRFHWVDGAKEAIRALNDRGYLVFVVTNQAGVARGFYSEADVQALHAHMQVELRQEGAHIDDFRYCPFHPDGTVERYRLTSDWRKPQPGMLQDLMARWNIKKSESLLIGDQGTDIEAADAAGLSGHKFAGGNLNEFLCRLGLI